jgi:hypothetical protein
VHVSGEVKLPSGLIFQQPLSHKQERNLGSFLPSDETRALLCVLPSSPSPGGVVDSNRGILLIFVTVFHGKTDYSEYFLFLYLLDI